MTKDLTDRELDALVAVEIMGLTQDDGGEFWEGRSHVGMLPAYSTSIESAWAVVEKMAKDGWHIQVSLLGKDWDAYFAGKGRHPDDVRTWAPTAARAISLAALSTVSRPTNEKEG